MNEANRKAIYEYLRSIGYDALWASKTVDLIAASWNVNGAPPLPERASERPASGRGAVEGR